LILFRTPTLRLRLQVGPQCRPILAKGGIDHRLLKLRNREGHDPSSFAYGEVHSRQIVGMTNAPIRRNHQQPRRAQT